MNKIAGAILILAGVISGHAVMTFLSQHPHIHVYEVPPDVATMVFVGIGVAIGLSVLGGVFLFKHD
jgi:ABC-type polysaccharide/polyol phosphate export permease